SFYEWQKTEKGKIAQRIHLENERMFGFAGLWDQWKHEEGSLFTCTILTKDANDYMNEIHHRMPVIVPENKEEEWLSRSFDTPKEVTQFIFSLSDPDLSHYAVTNHVNYAKNNDPTCIQPLTKE